MNVSQTSLIPQLEESRLGHIPAPMILCPEDDAEIKARTKAPLRKQQQSTEETRTQAEQHRYLLGKSGDFAFPFSPFVPFPRTELTQPS